MEDGQKLSGEELAKLRQQIKNEATEAAKEAAAIRTQGCELDGVSKHIDVNLSEDVMCAGIILSKPGEDEYYTVPEIIQVLREHKIVSGIVVDDIMNMVVNHIYDEEVVIARGKAVVQGTEGYYEFLIDMDEKREPVIREDGSVDYAAMNRLINVAEGDKIAIYHPAVQGSKGFNVCGGEINPKYAKELPNLSGKYIIKNDNNEYFAKISGKISRSGYNIEILNLYEINGDIDTINGNIEFYGDIIINGNVDSGVTLRAGRNVTVNGTVGGAKIFAGGDIVLSQGVQGYENGQINARGSVYAQFIEYSNIKAGGDVRANYIMNSNVTAGGMICAEGSRGSIIGGSVQGVRGIDIVDAGNISEPKTLLHAGFSEEDYREFNKLVSKENKIKKQLTETISEMGNLLNIGKAKGITPEQKDRIRQLNSIKLEADSEIDKIAEEKKFLGNKMMASTGASITIRGTVYRNTIISIDMAVMAIFKEEQFVRFVCRNEGIERKSVV